MHGYPLEIDFQYSPQEFVLSATDSGGLIAWQSFIIELLKPERVPCHLYTIRSKNSYYSFLRERKRISLFLEKLSLYLNSSNPKDITVTSLKPGSTVISWYNSSLCTSANRPSSWCAKEEIQEALRKLRVPDGYVNPHFVQAMLPEYKIDVIFNISYSGLLSCYGAIQWVFQQHCTAFTSRLGWLHVWKVPICLTKQPLCYCWTGSDHTSLLFLEVSQEDSWIKVYVSEQFPAKPCWCSDGWPTASQSSCTWVLGFTHTSIMETAFGSNHFSRAVF